ncbi:unnamed protein product [Rotaria sp. Silwood1]|nr:unnamed protein product [Rotaria sp. Silwood1]CAF1668124.1 unnamed protein product [Rotaria sp. Silwood1]
MMKLLEEIYQAQLTTLSHQKLNIATIPATNIQPIVFNGINLVDKESPIEPTALLCSSIRKLYTHDEIKNGIDFDGRMQSIKGMSGKTPVYVLKLYTAQVQSLVPLFCFESCVKSTQH